MSQPLVPPLGSLASLFWKEIPKELRGKVVSLDKLRELYPKTETSPGIELIEDNRTYSVYGIKLGGEERGLYEKIAYQCKQCNSLIAGPPQSEHENTMRPLSGRRGTTTRCARCYSELEFSGMMS